MKTENKILKIEFRVTESEREKIKENQLKSGMKSISSFILSRVLSEYFVAYKKKEIDSVIISKLDSVENNLNYSGNNLNQTVKILHSKKVQYIRQKEIDELKNNISEIQENIEHTKKTIEHIKNKI